MTLSTHKSILKQEPQIIRRNYVKLNYQWLPRCAQLCNKYNIKLLKVDIKKSGTRTYDGYDENDTYLYNYYYSESFQDKAIYEKICSFCDTKTSVIRFNNLYQCEKCALCSDRKSLFQVIQSSICYLNIDINLIYLITDYSGNSRIIHCCYCARTINIKSSFDLKTNVQIYDYHVSVQNNCKNTRFLYGKYLRIFCKECCELYDWTNTGLMKTCMALGCNNVDFSGLCYNHAICCVCDQQIKDNVYNKCGNKIYHSYCKNTTEKINFEQDRSNECIYYHELKDILYSNYVKKKHFKAMRISKRSKCKKNKKIKNYYKIGKDNKIKSRYMLNRKYNHYSHDKLVISYYEDMKRAIHRH